MFDNMKVKKFITKKYPRLNIEFIRNGKAMHDKDRSLNRIFLQGEAAQIF